MEIKIVIDAPKGWKRRVLLYVATPVALVAATALVARATVLNVDPSWIQDGGVVSASSLTTDFNNVNTNFTSLDQRIGAFENAPAARAYWNGTEPGQVLNGGGPHPLNFPEVDYDDGVGVTSRGPFIYAAPKAGVYSLHVTAEFGLSSLWAGDTLQLRWQRNAGAAATDNASLDWIYNPTGAPSFDLNAIGSDEVVLHQGDTLQVVGVVDASNNTGSDWQMRQGQVSVRWVRPLPSTLVDGG